MVLIALLRVLLAVLSRVAPAIAARIVYRLTLTTRRPSGQPHFADRHFGLSLTGCPPVDVVVHELAPATSTLATCRVLMVHGWNGMAADWRLIADKLVAAGCHVTAVDMPAHGAARGRFSSLPRFVRALKRIDRELGPFDVWVGHSLGAAAMVAAVARGARAHRLVLVNGLVTPARVLSDMGRAAGLSHGATHAFLNHIEDKEGMAFAEMDTARNATRVRAEALIVHDLDDRLVPLAEAQYLASVWRRARLIQTSGLGHRRILDDDGVANAITAFATGPV